MSKTLRFILIVTVLFLLIAIANQYSYNKSLSSLHVEPVTEDTFINWVTYTSDEYGFSIQYPSHWLIYEIKDEAYPSIAFARSSVENPTATIFRNHSTLLSIHPHGYGSENIAGKYVPSKLPRVQQSSEQYDLLLYDGTVFATVVNFKEVGVKNWKEYGFIMARLQLDDWQIECISSADQNKCDYFEGDTYAIRANVTDEDNREVIERMLASFKFID